MITVQVGGERRTLDELDEGWLHRQIGGRRGDGVPVCVQVAIQTERLHMRLSTAQCPPAGGGNRAPTPEEQRIFDLWQRHRLDQPDFPPGQLTAFLRELRRAL